MVTNKGVILDKINKILDEIEQNAQDALEDRKEYDEYDPMIEAEQAILDTIYLIRQELRKQ